IGSYLQNSDCKWHIAPVVDGGVRAVQSITLNIFQMDVESCCDYITFYAGSSADAPLVTSLNGSLPTVVVIEGEEVFANFVGPGAGFGGILEWDSENVGIFYYVTELEAEIPWDDLQCPFDCFGRGKCVRGECVCDFGYRNGLCKDDDQYRLARLFDACAGDEWYNATGWNVTDTALICDIDPENFCALERLQRGSIIHISGIPLLSLGDFSNNNLNGTIPNAISRFSTLVSLDLSNNLFYGSIPSSYTSISATTVSIDGNMIFCPIPTYASIITPASCHAITIFSIDPTSGSALGGGSVVVTGSGFMDVGLQCTRVGGGEADNTSLPI
ncbi:hypothetical protein BDK51DRAFT_34122, partial [Blyttiomyces helicus]